MVPNVKLHADPRRVQFVDVAEKLPGILIRRSSMVVQKMIPNVFDSNMHAQFGGEGHGFRKTPNRIRSTVSLVEWFEQHLTRPVSARRSSVRSCP